MILIGLGANLPSQFGNPAATCEAALAALQASGVSVVARSAWYETAPVPASVQPWFVNGVAAVATDLDPPDLLAALHRVEVDFGRARTVVNAARPLDLDLLAYGDLLRETPPPIVPHPRMHERAFVLLPLRDVDPHWRHPKSGMTIDALIAAMPYGQLIRPALGLEPPPKAT